MKYYSEEQMKEAIRMARSSYNLFTTPFMYDQDEVLEQLTPIELPSDDDIEDYANDNTESISFVNGARWMRDKIQGGNNEPRLD